MIVTIIVAVVALITGCIISFQWGFRKGLLAGEDVLTFLNIMNDALEEYLESDETCSQ